ncbi:MAG: sulfatase-like hydrolase/transferase, partial [Planctomycetes bacterium]|nr:sulfatase-like hydrolase/transferase [Planctomycetota bacterium]
MNGYKISRRDFLRAAGIAAIAMGLPATAKKTKPVKPNIIFFIADDMRPEMFNCLGQGKGRNLTPNIDRLVSEGTILTNQHVVSPVCTPSRYNCLTGRYASRATNEEFTSFTRKNDGQTVIQWNSFMTSKDVTLAKLLKRGGYTTGMVGKNHVVEVKDFYQFPD